MRSNDHEACFDIYAESTTGDVVIDAVYERNLRIEDLYNVKITEYKPTVETAADAMRTAVAAGEDAADAVVESFSRLCTLASNGYLFDMASNLQYGRDLTVSTWEKNIDKAEAGLEAR